MHFRYLFLVSFLSAALSDAPAWSAESVRVIDCIRSGNSARDIIVDSDCLVRGLRNGADPNWIEREKGKRDMSTLFSFVFLVSLSDDPKTISAGTEAVQTLVAAGAKLQPVDAEILVWPISWGKVSLVRILLEIGADASAWPNPKMGTALTPVEMAAAKGHDQIVELLVKYGATRPNAKTVLLERFVESATRGSIEELAALISHGAPVNGKNSNNQTALINALGSTMPSDCEALSKIRWLLQNGADANLEGDGFGMRRTRPLHVAVWIAAHLYKAKRQTVCAEQILRELIKGGARVAARDSTGRTPLHIAAELNHLAAARLLLELGSTVMPRDEKGRAPIDMAESSEMIALLKKHGATER